MTPEPAQTIRAALDAICQDSLETTLDATLANREWAMKQSVSSLFVQAAEALAVLERRLEDAETQWMEAQEAGLELAGENIRLERWVVENAEEVGLLERRLAEKDEALAEALLVIGELQAAIRKADIAREALRAEPTKEEA